MWDELDHPFAFPVHLLDGLFLGRLRQRRSWQELVVVRLVKRDGSPVARVSLPRPPRERGAPVLVEVECRQGRLALRAWAEDDQGYVEATVPFDGSP